MAEEHTDLVKIWVDDFAGSLKVKMRPEIIRAVIDESHRKGLRVAAHIHDHALRSPTRRRETQNVLPNEYINWRGKQVETVG